MSTESNKSALKEVRDQLFIDTADGEYLSIVTANLGFNRPPFGFHNDDEWRALAKNLALGPKNVETAFRKILNICLGPDRLRSGVLAEAAALGAVTLTLEDASDLLQIGTIVLSAGSPEEETLPYCFVDYDTSKVFLQSATLSAHNTLATSSNFLLSSIVVAATSVPLVDSTNFPTTGFPYTIAINDELLSVTANDTVTSILTVDPVVSAHSGFSAGYVRKALQKETFVGRTFLVFDTQDTEDFPLTGWIRLGAGTAAEEIVFYNDNESSENTLFLQTPLAFAHPVSESVELLETGARVHTANAAQLPVYWSIFDTTHDTVKVRIPKAGLDLRIIDATWLHSAVLATVGSTTLGTETLTTDTVLDVVSTANFATSGLLTINGVDGFFYEEITSATSLTLASPVGSILTIGTTVVQQSLAHAGTDLDDGNPRDLSGAVQDFRYPGPYVYDPTNLAPSVTSYALTSIHPPAATSMSNSLVARETLDCDDLSLWDLVTLPAKARIGVGTGFSEDTNVVDVTLRAQTDLAELSSPTLIGDVTLLVDTSACADPNDSFPETVAAASANFTVVLDRGNANEEFALVSAESYLSGPMIATLVIKSAWVGAGTPTATLSVAHSASETVDLVYDVLTVDALQKQHFAPTVSPTTSGHKVEYLSESVTLSSTVGFNQIDGAALLNFGRGRVDARQRIASVISPTVFQLVTTEFFPTTGFPYQVVLSPGRSTQELIQVSANNVSLNQLTFASTPANIHSAGSVPFGNYVEFSTGDQEVIEYQDVDTNDLILNPPQVLQKHTVGEVVVKTSEFSNPRLDGFSYAFLLPPDLLICVREMFELVRAAGIKVIITEY